MAKGWITDHALVKSVAGNLCEAAVILPKQLLKVERLTQTLDMPFSQIQILILLSGGDCTITSISHFLGIAKPNSTPLLDRLCKRGLVLRERSKTDRRVVNVSLTDAGRETFQQIQEMVIQQIGAWEERFSRSEVKRLNAALSCIIGLMNYTKTSDQQLDES